MTLKEALQVLMDERLSDWIYDVRERALQDISFDSISLSWDHPRVKRFSEACEVIENVVKEESESPMPTTGEK